MQPYVIFYRAFPLFRNQHVISYTVDPHIVSDRGIQQPGWIIRAHFSESCRLAPEVAYARIVSGYVAFCRVADTTPQPFHRGPDNPWAGWPEWSNEIIREAEWRQFADHAPHYAEQPVDRIRAKCQWYAGREHTCLTDTPEWRLVGWYPVVDNAGNLTGELIEVTQSTPVQFAAGGRCAVACPAEVDHA